MKRFRGGLVFKAHRLSHHSTLGLRVTKKKNAGLLQANSRLESEAIEKSVEIVQIAGGVLRDRVQGQRQVGRQAHRQGPEGLPSPPPKIYVYCILKYTFTIFITLHIRLKAAFTTRYIRQKQHGTEQAVKRVATSEKHCPYFDESVSS